MSLIGNWYSNKNILITGVTGFIGKVLVEKLLRTCPDIGEIYLLVRAKKGLTASDRKDKIFENILFSTLKAKFPEQLKKVRLIEGSLSNSGLNLTETDEEYLKNNCNIIFHIAASVQFDKKLHDIAETNIFGLKYFLELAKEIKNLESFVFCSTAFSLYYDVELDEIGYEAPMKSDELKKVLTHYDEEFINPLTIKLLDRHANTYAFTKCIAEDLIRDYVKYFPIAIVRPSIVSQAAYDPLPGWTEGINGFNGWGIVAGFGILKCLFANDNYPRCVIPVDLASNGLILIGWQAAIKQSDEVLYYNAAEDIETAIHHPYKDLVAASHALSYVHPFEIMIMSFNYTVTTNKIYFKLMEIWYHYIVGVFLDLLLILFRRKPMLIRVHRKIIANMGPVQYYITNPFTFKTRNFNQLENLLNDEDKGTYRVNVSEAIDDEYCNNGFLGVRTYLLKQSLDTIPRSKKIHLTLYYAGRIFHIFVGYFIIKFIYKNYLKDYFE